MTLHFALTLHNNNALKYQKLLISSVVRNPFTFWKTHFSTGSYVTKDARHFRFVNLNYRPDVIKYRILPHPDLRRFRVWRHFWSGNKNYFANRKWRTFVITSLPAGKEIISETGSGAPSPQHYFRLRKDEGSKMEVTYLQSKN